MIERIKNHIHQQLPNGKLNEISPQENIQKGMRFVNLVNEIYIICQQQKKILHEEDQSIQHQQAEEQVQQANKQLQQAEKQLQQTKKKLEPKQEILRQINKQQILFNDVIEHNKIIVVQKLTTE